MRQPARAVGALLALVVCAFPQTATACGSCVSPTGPGSTITAPWQRWALQLGQLTQFAHGGFSHAGTYRALGSDSFDRVGILTAAGGYRPWRRFEVAAAVPFGTAMIGAPDFRSTTTGWGDFQTRIRYTAIEEPAFAPVDRIRPPTVGIGLGLRAPTGTLARAGTSTFVGGSMGTSASSLSLGAWEPSLAVDVRRSIGLHHQVALVISGAWRAPDDAIGGSRQLGPRGAIRLMALRMTSRASFGCFVDLAGEGRVAYGDRASANTAQHLAAVGAFVVFKSDVFGSVQGGRTGLAISHTPPLSFLGENSIAATSLSVYVRFGR